MKTLFWIIKLLLFFIALTFAVKNTDVVTVRYYLGVQWQAPLIFVILAVFCLGAVAGVFASLTHIVRLRREISRLRRETSVMQPAAGSATSAAPPRIADAL
jgi:lipopolysaccharide assembly protein A